MKRCEEDVIDGQTWTKGRQKGSQDGEFRVFQKQKYKKSKFCLGFRFFSFIFPLFDFRCKKIILKV